LRASLFSSIDAWVAAPAKPPFFRGKKSALARGKSKSGDRQALSRAERLISGSRRLARGHTVPPSAVNAAGVFAQKPWNHAASVLNP
jgi:hypothetical protein